MLKDTVQFKLYSTEQTTKNYTVVRHMIASRQQRKRYRVLRPKIPMFPDVCIRFDDNRTMTTNMISKISDGISSYEDRRDEICSTIWLATRGLLREAKPVWLLRHAYRCVAPLCSASRSLRCCCYARSTLTYTAHSCSIQCMGFSF